MISVTDTGKGMDSTTQERIFDPFFTTKDQESGTGLGLASAYGIIKNHAGIINVYSEVDIGTTFNIYLPASAKQPQEVKETSTRIRSGKETILLIDDEKIVLDVGQQMLTRLGYTALVAANGEVAVEFFQKEHENIDLIILDMIMPKFSGGETFDKLKEINPNVKVILSSGYSINGQANEILSRGCHGFIQKPFNLEQLSLKIRKVLDE
jgi:CheY-like chemotaxis protein